ncbi:MAG: DUF1638 domain-containing protein [Candidatus Methanospirareceae archaeon]
MHIGVITCEILRKEITDVIRRAGVKEIFFVLPETTNSAIIVLHQGVIARFSSEFTDDGGFLLKTRRLEEIRKEIRDIRDSAIIKVLELRMHDHPDVLWTEIEESIKKMSSMVDLILLGYGLCGSTAERVERMIREAPVPILIPRDGEDGAILNNCIEIALGRERVQSLLTEEVGTFFMTPVGASIIHEPQVILESTTNIMAGRMERHAPGETKRIIQLMKNHYNRVVKIEYSEADEKDEEYAETVKNFARKFNLEIKRVKGSSKIVCELLEGMEF